MKTWLWLFLCLSLALRAEDITTNDGRVLADAKITARDPNGVTVSHADGIAKLAWRDLPKNVLDRYSEYFAELKTGAETKRRDEAARFDKIAEAAVVAERDKTTHVRGRVTQVLPNGLLLECREPVAPRTNRLQRLTGAAGFGPEPSDVFGAVVVVGHPAQKTKAEGDWVTIEGAATGNVRLLTVLGAERTVKAFRVVSTHE